MSDRLETLIWSLYGIVAAAVAVTLGIVGVSSTGWTIYGVTVGLIAATIGVVSYYLKSKDKDKSDKDVVTE